MNEPTFSIIVPVYNTEKNYLRDCVDSLTAQTYKNIQILLVNDGSDKECSHLCREFVLKDDRIKLYEQEHRGVSTARNNGIRNADGRWIIFVDSDDFIEPDTCSRLYTLISEHEYDMLAYNIVEEYENGIQIRDHCLGNGAYYVDCPEKRELLCRKAVSKVPGNYGEPQNCSLFLFSGFVYNREWLLRNQLMFSTELKRGEDTLFVLLCMEKVKSLYFLEDIMYHYRKYSNGITSTISDDIVEQRKLFAAAALPVIERINREISVQKRSIAYRTLYNDYCESLFLVLTWTLNVLYDKSSSIAEDTHQMAIDLVKSREMAPALQKCSNDRLEVTMSKALLRAGFVSAYRTLHCIFNRFR